MEITLNSPEALRGLEQLRRNFGDRIVLGAGTVLCTDEVHAALDAGATFIVAPDTDADVISACKSRNILMIPGAYTPTEVKRAYQLGGNLVKLFPAETPAYVKAVHTPLNHIPLLATGGINSDNAAKFLGAGASALGVGGSLTKPDLSLDEISRRANALLDAVRHI